VVRGTTLTIDLCAPPSSAAAEIHRGPGGCVTLSGVRTTSGAVTSTGSEHNLFEHQFSVLLRNSDGRALAQRPVSAGGGRWSTTLHYRASRWQLGTSEAADFSAKDGSLVCLVQQRVTLPAAGAGAAAVYVTDYAGNAVAQYDVGWTVPSGQRRRQPCGPGATRSALPPALTEAVCMSPTTATATSRSTP
jgi:immunoglobulin-like protein involved in spore germination